jgi:hypothetical protein
MRIRKILPLALLAVGMLFMLTSCDKLLDFIFSSNTINVNVQAPISNYYTYAAGGTVTVYLYGNGTTYQAGPEACQYVDGYGYANYTFSFSKLPNDTYSITTVYSGLHHTGTGSATFFYDPVNYYTNWITMPYSGGGSPATANVVVVMP